MARLNDRNTLNPKNPAVMDRVDYAVRFWGFTALVAIPAIAVTIIAYINPFWFRESGINLAQKFIKKCSWVRSDLVTPIVNKYKTFETLKNI